MQPALARDEDSDSESDIVQRYDRLVLRLANRFVQAEDLAQVGRIALLEAARSWRAKDVHSSRFVTYAYRHIFGAMLDCVTREAERMEIESASELPETTSSPDLVYEAKEMLEAALSPEERTIVWGFYVDGKEIRQIATETGASKSSVHRTLTGALENIRERA